MIRISALNDSSSSEDESACPQVTQTKEAKEAEAFAAYNKALSNQQSGNCEYAEKLLRNLLDHPFLKDAASLVETDDGPTAATLVHPGLQLLYLVHKNLAAIFFQRKDLKKAMESYIEAVKIDSSEVTVWFKMGQIALKIHKYTLAKICFQQALQCNPSHWPSLDKSITVTFALGDYLMCLEHISCALEKDCHYVKGLALRKKILSEQPSLESITKDLFSYCDPQIHTIAVDEEDSKEYLDECQKMRLKQRELYENYMEEEYKPMTFLKPLAPFTWKNVGECLLELYQFATTSNPPKSLGLEVDLRDYNFLDQSLIFGKDPEEKDKKDGKQKSVAKAPIRLSTISTQLLKEQDNDFPSQGSPFQRAMEQGNDNPPTTPESLTVGNNAKENALLQRLQGREKNLGQQNDQIETSKKTTSAEKTSSINPLADLEDMDVGNDFSEMASLEEAMDITDLNIADIQKTDFAPDLFLKASEDDLGLGGDVKTLESVLSSVIDMELGQPTDNTPVIGSKTSRQDSEEPIPRSPTPSLDKASSAATCEVNDVSQSKEAPTVDQPTPQEAVTSPKDLSRSAISSIKHPQQTSSEISPSQSHCNPSRSVSLHLSVKTPKISEHENMELSEKAVSDEKSADQAGSSPSQYSPSLTQSIVASLLSPKSELTKGNVGCTSISTPSNKSNTSDQQNNSSLYLTPVGTSTHTQKTSELSTLNQGTITPDIQKVKNVTHFSPSSPSSRKSAVGVKQQTNQQAALTTPKKVESNAPLTPSNRLGSLSTVDLIEDVVRRHIMGPPSKEVSPHQTSPQSTQHKVSPAASSNTQPGPSSITNKTPALNRIPVHSLQSPTSNRTHTDRKSLSQGNNNMSPLNPCSPNSVFQSQLSITSPSKTADFCSPPQLLSQNFFRAQRSLPFIHGSPTFQGNQFLRHSLSVDAPTYLPFGNEVMPAGRISESISLPQHHLNTLSVLDTKALLNASLSGSPMAPSGFNLQSQSTPWRPSFARSSSFPGYLTAPSTYSPQDLHMFPGGTTLTSHPSSHNPSLMDVYPPALYPDLARFSSTMSSSVRQMPTSVLLSSPPTSLLNPFSSALSHSLSPSIISATKKSSSGERKSLGLTAYLPAVSSQTQPKSPSKAKATSTSQGRKQQRLSPNHQPFEGGRDDPYQTIVKSLLEVNNQPKSQHSAKSPTGSGTPSLEKNTHTGAGSKSGTKRAPKRKSELSSLTDDWALAYKRRSTRNRSSTSKKKESESPDFDKLMKQYFPHTLLNLKDDISEEGSLLNESQTLITRTSQTKEDKKLDVPLLEETEERDVKDYVKSCLRGHGLLQMIHVYLLRLGERSGCRWYPGLTEIYLKLFDCLRKHLTIPTIWLGDDEDVSLSRLRELAIILLTKAELSVSKVVSDLSVLGSPSPSKLASCRVPNEVDLFGEFHNKDMFFLDALVYRDDVFSQESMTLTQFCARLYWLQAKQCQALLQTLDAVDFFLMVKAVLEESKEKEGEGEGLAIVLPNVGSDGLISLQEVNQMMDNVQRYQSLEDTRNLHGQGEFAKVVENLVATFNDKTAPNKSSGSKERPSQLLLLLDSLHSLGRLSELIQWGEICLHEALLHYQRAPSLQLRQDWEATLVSLFEKIDRVLDQENNILGNLSHHRLVRLAHNLVSVIQTVLDVADGVTEMPIASVRPWKILYRVLQFEEQSVAKGKLESSGNPREEEMDVEQSGEEGEIRPSLAMLIKSHEYLGRHSWCTKENGLLLTFIMSILGKELSARDSDEDDDDEDATSAFEQCVFCLYNHPNKRGRARHLSDHNAPPVEMSWEGAGPVFHFFAPHTIPEFDSYKTSTISTDVEHLLRKIFTLIPDSLQPGERHTTVVDYIEGGISRTLPEACSPPTSPSDSSADPYKICSLIYYLLGDFYFKNKEPAKAVKFYQLDVSVNSSRLDAWVGLGLARMSQLMQKLNSTELKVETPVVKKSEAALRCFRRAVGLDDSNRKLWLEFGSLAYQLHSHASRQIHYRNMFDISGEMLMKSRSRRTEMLDLAKESYRRANECEGDGSEDDWLTHYMMGKVAEKQGQSPKVFLDSYKQAALCLHEEEAVYPAKLLFTTLPPHLALEALEVFFRIQASSLKLVLSGCDYNCLKTLDSFITDSHEGYFARREEKLSQNVESTKSDILPPSSSKPAVNPTNQTPQLNKKQKKIYHRTPLDHNYSRHKSVSDSQSEGEERKDQGQTGLRQAEDMEGSSDWSQEETFHSPKPASTSGQTAAAFDVFEISSPHISKFQESSSSDLNKLQAPPAKPRDQTAVQQGDSLGDNKDAEIPMEAENAETKDQSIETLESSFSHEENKSLKLQGVKKEKDIGPNKTEPQITAKGTTMEVDTMDVGDLGKQNFDNRTNAKDTDLISEGNQVQGSRNIEQPEKSSALRQVSMGFEISTDENKETSDVCMEQEKEGSTDTEMEEDNKVSVGISDEVKNRHTPSHELENERIKEGSSSVVEAVEDSMLKEKAPSSGLSSAQNREKWETEDQEKSTTKMASDTDSCVDSTSTSPNDAGEISQSVKVVGETCQSVNVAGETSQSVNVGGETSQSVNVVSETSQSVKAAKETNQSENVVSETSQSVKPTEETSQSENVVSETSQSVKVVGETSQSVNVVSETSQSVKATKETNQSENVVSETSQYENVVSETSQSVKATEETNQSENVVNETSQSVKATEETSQSENVVSETSRSVKATEETNQSENVVSDTSQSMKVAGETSQSVNVFSETILSVKATEETNQSENVVSETSQSVKDSEETSQSENVVSDTSQSVKVAGETNQSENVVSETTQSVKVAGETSQSVKVADETILSVKATEETNQSENVVSETSQSVKDSEETSQSENVVSDTSQSVKVAGETNQSENVVSETTQSVKVAGETSQSVKVADETIQSVNVAGKTGQSLKVTEEMEATPVSEADVKKLRTEVRQKCIAGLELCATRYSCHYKSLYRLAHVYYVLKDYSKARDLLLGCPDWQQQPHMPAPGLFSERKQNNLFQGLWKIPIEDIDRSGSFASHVHRSVRLLLNVLADQGDLDMLLHIRNQLRRTPDAGKKFLRDSERLVLAEEAYAKCLFSVEQSMERGDNWSESRREDNLLTVYRVWSVGKGGKHGFAATRVLHMAFKLMMKGRTDVNRLTPEQAILYCNQNLSKLLTPAAPNQSQAFQKSVVERAKQSQVQTPTGLNLEKLDKARLRQGDPKTEDDLGKIESIMTKASAVYETDKLERETQPTYCQPTSSPIPQATPSQPTCQPTPIPQVTLSQLYAGSTPLPPQSEAVCSTSQEDGDVIVISDHE